MAGSCQGVGGQKPGTEWRAQDWGWYSGPPCSSRARTVSEVGPAPAPPGPASGQAGLHSQHCLGHLGQGSQAQLNWGPGQIALLCPPIPFSLEREGCVGKWERRKLPESLASHPPAYTGGLQMSSGAGYDPKSPDSTRSPSFPGQQTWKSSPPPPVPLTMKFISTPISGVPSAPLTGWA